MKVRRELIDRLQRVLIEEGIKISDNDAATLIKFARVKHKVNEAYCNGEVEHRDKMTLFRYAKDALRILKPLEIPVQVQNDPRGLPVRLFFKSGRYNTFGGVEHGFGIEID